MARFCTLSSSSKGNCAYLSGGDTSLLVDVGISLTQIKKQLGSQGRELSELSGILITHEHTDHVRGLTALCNATKLPVYSAPETLECLVNKGLIPAGIELIPVAEDSFTIGDIQVTPFDTPHDAVHSLGFRMELPDGNVVAVSTDLGYVTPTVREHLEGCDLVLLESNFDPGMLNCSSYPYNLKRRIKGELGHLANEDCAEEISHLIKSGVSRFILGHLSQENNVPELAYETTKGVLIEEQMVEGIDYLLSVAPAKEAHTMVVF